MRTRNIAQFANREASGVALSEDMRQWERLLALAERSPRGAVCYAQRLMSATDVSDDVRACTSLYLGWALLRWERLAEARVQLQETRVQLERLKDAAALRHCRHGELALALAAGEGAGLQVDLYKLASEYDAAGQHREAVSVRLDQAAHLNVLGRPRETLEVVEALAPLVEKLGRARDEARLHRVAAIAYGMTGDTVRSRGLLGRAEERYTLLRQPIDVAKCQLERAWAYMRQEQFDVAAAELHTALRTFQRFDLPLQIAFCHRNLGIIANRQGRFNDALAETSRAREHFIALRRHDHAANCDVEIGNVAYYSGLFELAVVAYQRAERTYDSLSMGRLALISRRNQALVLRNQGLFTEALALLRVLEHEVQALGDDLELVELTFAQAQVFADRGQPGEALAMLQDALERFTALGADASAASCRLEQGWLALRQGDAAVAEQAFREAAAPLADRPDPLWRIDYGRGRAAELLGDAAAALAFYQKASVTVAGMRSTLASEHASSALFSQARQLHHDALRLAAQLGHASVVLDLVEQQRALALHHQMLHAIIVTPELRRELDLRRLHLQQLSIADAEPQAIDSALQSYIELILRGRHIQPSGDVARQPRLDQEVLRAHLDSAYSEGWLALSYTHLADEILIVSLDRAGCALTRVPLDARLRRLIDRATLPQYRWLMYHNGAPKDGSEEDSSDLTTLSALLLPAEVRAQLTPRTRLLIVPDDRLHSIPWSALRCHRQWLCERATIHVLPSLGLWEVLKARRPRSSAALLIGCSQFAGRADDIPHVPVELSAIESLWPSEVRRLEDVEARREVLMQLAAQGMLSNVALVHIASHAQIISCQGVLAHVKLWDEDLYVDDVSALGLAGALVVLSVCHGAASTILPGEELLGLSRGLLAAGARDVMASLWETYDRGAIHLLKPFYGELLRGADPASALAYAQRTLINGGRAIDEALASPLFWGSYSVLGASCEVGPPAGGTTPAASHAER
jgi:CHAT domain-containing protein